MSLIVSPRISGYSFSSRIRFCRNHARSERELDESILARLHVRRFILDAGTESSPLCSLRYIFAVFGGITNIVIFIRSILIYRNSNFSGGTLESKSASASRIGTHPILPLQKLRGSTSLSPIATGGSQLNFITITREWEVKVDTERTSLDTDSEKVERFDVDLGKAGVYGMSSRSEGPGWNVCFDR